MFQYNPDTLPRTLQPQMAGGGEGDDRSEALRLKGAAGRDHQGRRRDRRHRPARPGRPDGPSHGHLPAALGARDARLPEDARWSSPTPCCWRSARSRSSRPSAPLTLFVWGPKRVLPVKLTEFSITEEAYDAALNPIRAKVSLGLRVLSYSDLPLTQPGLRAVPRAPGGQGGDGGRRDPPAASGDVDRRRREAPLMFDDQQPLRHRRDATTRAARRPHGHLHAPPLPARRHAMPLPMGEAVGPAGRPARPDRRAHARRPGAVLAHLRRQRRARSRDARATGPRLRSPRARSHEPARHPPHAADRPDGAAAGAADR